MSFKTVDDYLSWSSRLQTESQLTSCEFSLQSHQLSQETPVDTTDEAGNAESAKRDDAQRNYWVLAPSRKSVLWEDWYKIVFSVPIWSQFSPSVKPQVIGVLAMSTDFDAFEGLERTLVGGNPIVLLDTRPDFLDKNRNEGLILEHPYYKDRTDHDKRPRISGELLEKMKVAQANGLDQFLAGYRAPLALNPQQLFWGAIEPIEYELDSEDGKNDPRVGWFWSKTKISNRSAILA